MKDLTWISRNIIEIDLENIYWNYGNSILRFLYLI